MQQISSFGFLVVAFVASAICGLLTIPIVLDFCKEKGLYDIPDKRKVHTAAIPRLGGITFLPSVLIGCVVAVILANMTNTQEVTLGLWTVYFGIGLSAIYMVGLFDDLFGVGPKVKLAVQLLAACMLPVSGLWLNNLYGLFGINELPFWIGAPLTVLVVAFISNAINLIDGIDGLSGSLTFIALAGFAWFFARWELGYYVVGIVAFMGIIAAYLYFNLFGSVEKNRKIFMGDTGSLSIGFMLAFLSLKVSMNNEYVMPFSGTGFLLALTVLLIPTFDVFRVAIVRLRHHRSPMAADKNHIHHKLMRTGLSAHGTLVAIILIELSFILLNILLSQTVSLTWTVVADIVVYIAMHYTIDTIIRHKNNEPLVFE